MAGGFGARADGRFDVPIGSVYPSRTAAVRALFSFSGGNGHLEPMLPVARALVAAGHSVSFTCRRSMVSVVEEEGFSASPSGPDLEEQSEITPLVELDAEREDRVLRYGFAGRTAAARATDLLTLLRVARPAVVVRDETDFGAAVAAERFGVACATVLVLAAGSFVRREVVAEALTGVRAGHDLAPDPDLHMLTRGLVLSPFPPSFRDPAFPLPPTAHAIRPAALDGGTADPVPPWLARLDDRPLVYATLGTVFNRESGDLFDRLLEGLRDLPAEIVVTVGRHLDPARFGPQPAHVHVERYVPQSAVLPRCSAVVSHGGSGSVVGALAHGVPLVVLPLGADQPLNAARCEALGVGRTLDGLRASPADIGGAVRAVLADPAYTHNAAAIAAECGALPEAASAVPLLERLAG